jgi:hypothetical protein
VDVWEYFQSRERECRDLSLAPDTSFDEMCMEEEGSDGQRGIFYGRLVLSERAFLNVFELVEVTGSGVHREQYSYYLIVDGFEEWGYDRDPSHDPPVHGHQGRDHRWVPAERVTFREVAEMAWQTVSRLGVER